MADLLEQDDSVGGVTQMDEVVKIVKDAATLSQTEQDLIMVALMATQDERLLVRFSHSAALGKVHGWLTTSMEPPQPARTLAVLRLLGHLVRTVQSLQTSGVGKTVNKLRKAADEKVQAGAAELLGKWKAIASQKPAPAAEPAKPAASKRQLPDTPVAAAAPEKRPKPGSAGGDLDDSLDAALGAQAPRKASLKPDHLRVKRSVVPMSVSVTSSRVGAVGGALNSPSSPANGTTSKQPSPVAPAAENRV